MKLLTVLIFLLSYVNIQLKNLLRYFTTMTTSHHDLTALFGFFIILVVSSQLVSGIMLSFSLIPEPMLIPISRNEEDIENMFIDDFFYVHERGVDLIFIFSYCHLFRKLYLNSVDVEQEIS